MCEAPGHSENGHREHICIYACTHTTCFQVYMWLVQGRTGYPMVDAVARCLLRGGWINFRMRAMVFSFAHYHLNLHWCAALAAPAAAQHSSITLGNLAPCLLMFSSPPCLALMPSPPPGASPPTSWRRTSSTTSRASTTRRPRCRRAPRASTHSGARPERQGSAELAQEAVSVAAQPDCICARLLPQGLLSQQAGAGPGPRGRVHSQVRMQAWRVVSFWLLPSNPRRCFSLVLPPPS